MKPDPYVEQMMRLFARWPTEESRAAVLMAEYRVLWDEAGSQRFTAAVTGLVRESPYQFMPSLPEVRGFLPESTAGKAKWNCRDCLGSGWRMVAPDAEFAERVRAGARRCECRER